jgi:magnesium chelatase subunit I
MNYSSLTTFGELKAAGYQSLGIKDEMRRNLIAALQENRNVFEGIFGYDDSVIPDIQRAILSRHNILLLGLRGQAKTRIARLLIRLLDEYVPIVAGSEINDDPFQPVSKYAKDKIAELGDGTPITWVHRSERYTEKLATPDVTTADLIGDVDPIKAAALKLPYADERVIHFGLTPRSNRSIFVINELPDLQARIQVALFNILQEEDIQIRGFKMRLPLDILFVFTANPEDYTNRGSIVTPLKDRIDSQILTHYPKDILTSKQITRQEARLTESQRSAIHCDELILTLLEQTAFEARSSEYIDSKSGVSARLTISAYENLISAAERRMLLHSETKTNVRVTDLYSVIPAITGKIELVYEGEQEGPGKVAQLLLGKAIRTVFATLFPSPEKLKKAQEKNLYQPVIDWFNRGNTIDLLFDETDASYREAIAGLDFLRDIVRKFHPALNETQILLYMEFALHGLSEYSQLSKMKLERSVKFSDLISSMFNPAPDEGEEDDFDEEDFK